MTKQQYIEYLVATPSNYTCTHLANHLEGEAATSHDSISDYLRREKLTPRRLWEVVEPLLHDSAESYLIVDDSVQNKQYSQKIELVKLQYSGAEGGLVRGIGVVNLLHSSGLQTSGETGDFFPIDFRVYAPETDGKTKNQHFLEMLIRAKSDKRLKANTVLFDSWYASVDNLKMIHRLGMVFVTTLKSNRLVSTSKEQYQTSKEQAKPKDGKNSSKNKGYIHLDTVEWTPDTLKYGQLVKLQEMPFLVRLFKMVATNGDIEWVITNRDLDPEDQDNQDTEGEAQVRLTADDVQDENAVRWQIEQMHRELKQLVGTEKCQCRKGRAQRNHLACCYLAWLTLKVHARKVGTTLYTAHANLLRDFLRAQLRQPTITAYAGA